MARILKENYIIRQNVRATAHADELNEVLKTISTRWKMMVLLEISSGADRFNKLRPVFPTTSDTVLIQRLRKLETEQLIFKNMIVDEAALKATYELTTKGRALLQIIKQLQQWGSHWSSSLSITSYT